MVKVPQPSRQPHTQTELFRAILSKRDLLDAVGVRVIVGMCARSTENDRNPFGCVTEVVAPVVDLLRVRRIVHRKVEVQRLSKGRIRIDRNVVQFGADTIRNRLQKQLLPLAGSFFVRFRPININVHLRDNLVDAEQSGSPAKWREPSRPFSSPACQTNRERAARFRSGSEAPWRLPWIDTVPEPSSSAPFQIRSSVAPSVIRPGERPVRPGPESGLNDLCFGIADVIVVRAECHGRSFSLGSVPSDDADHIASELRAQDPVVRIDVEGERRTFLRETFGGGSPLAAFSFNSARTSHRRR